MALQLHGNLPSSLPFDVDLLPSSFGFVGAIIVVCSALLVARLKKELGLLAGTFLFGLGVLELALQVAG